MHRYSDEIKNKAIDLYRQGHSAANISSVIGANEATIRAWLRRKRIDIKSGGMYNIKYDESLLNQIVELYDKGFNTPQIDELLNIRKGTSWYLLNKNNYKLNHRGPKSKIDNEGYFDTIDTEEKSYFLGWIMADGNVSIYNSQYSLKIHVSLKDKEIVDKFLQSIKSTNKTKIKNGKHPSYYVSLTSVHMCKTLIGYGVCPRKSGFEKFPKDIPLNLHNHFIRGVFDGDGITDICRNRSGFVGSKEMLAKILEIIDRKDMKLIQNKKNENIYYFLGGKKFTRSLYDFLYKDSTIWLERKRDRMQLICSN
jgi:intein-encoded DNA endonuclease-like protein